MSGSSVTGLTGAEVQARRQSGQGNDVKLATSRSYSDIVKTNVFGPINLVLYAIGIGMILVGDFRSAIATVMLVVFNAIVGVIQEMLAKRKLDNIALLARAKVTVRRDGQDQEVDPSDLVLGDLLVVKVGDQVPVDGTLVDDGKLEVDESALTGESDPIEKHKGDQVLSGSICITGTALVEATKVGEQSFANQLTKNARKFKLEQTPLQRDVNQLLRILLLIVVFFTVVLVVALWVLRLPFDSWLQLLAVLTGSISAGLLVFITLNYSWGAVRIGKQGGLVQQINAVESLSNVTVLCTDKTGTLTTNKIKYHDVYATGDDKAALEQLLADFAASASSTNKTTDAILAWKQGAKHNVVDEVPFSSARKWSALAIDGSANAARPPCTASTFSARWRCSSSISRSALPRCSSWKPGQTPASACWSSPPTPTVMTLHGADGQPVLPALTLLGLISFSDELRPHLEETIHAFMQNGVKLKVISGDNPQTVAALARQAGFPGDLKAVSGPELAAMGPGQFAQTAEEATVFGRITPQQKEQLVDALKSKGEYVAMTGDGVNDVLSLKKADIGIAMESGTPATRSVAGMILLGDSFAVMPKAVTEGQRIAASIQNILKTYMVTVFAMLLLVVALGILQLGFPFLAAQNTMMSFFARGAPPAVLSLTAVAILRRPRLSTNIMHFTLPAALLIALLGMLLYTGAFFVTQRQLAHVEITSEMTDMIERTARVPIGSMTNDQIEHAAIYYTAQTSLVTFFVLTGILLMLFAEPPLRWFVGGSPYRGSWLVVVAAAALIGGYYIVLMLSGVRAFFELVPLPPLFHGVIWATTGVWIVVQRWAYRANLLEHFLAIPVKVDYVGKAAPAATATSIPAAQSKAPPI